MFGVFERILKRGRYSPLNVIEVSKSALLANYKYLCSLDKSLRVAPVLKSNAYGHGIVQVGKILDKTKAPFLCVDSLYEAFELLKAKVKTPVLIMGYTDPENLKVKKLPFSYVVYSIEQAEGIAKHQPGVGVHIKVDTGMHRLGVTLEDLPGLLKSLKELKLEVDGLMSHLANPEDLNDPITSEQISNFEKAKEVVRRFGFKPKWFHIGASNGLTHRKELDLSKFSNMVRVGLASYGVDPLAKNTELQPVLKLVTHIAQIKGLEKGDRVGYGRTFRARRDMTIGILPIGYYDGVDRRLSNNGWVLVNNTACRIVGRVSMNITTVDLTEIKSPKVGQEVVVYSNKASDPNSLSKVAKAIDTTPSEVLSRLVFSTRREVVG